MNCSTIKITENIFALYFRRENLSQMPKLTAFLKESMRMFAPVPVVGRVLKTPLQFGECVIPEGTHIEVNMHMIHHHPDVWPDHEVTLS